MSLRRWSRWGTWAVALLFLCFALLACGTQGGSTDAPLATVRVESALTVVPTAELTLVPPTEPSQPSATSEPMPSPTLSVAKPATESPEPVDAATITPVVAAAGVASELEALVGAALLTPTAEGAVGISGVKAFPFEMADGRTVWVVYSLGLRSFEPLQPHFVAVYERGADGWQELASLALQAPDYVNEGAVTSIAVASESLWLAVDGGVGAHGGTFDLLRFDGSTLKQEVEYTHSSPAPGRLMDLNRDGTPEIVLDASDPYVFCYACGVRLTNFSVLRWTGLGWEPLVLEPLPESASEELRTLTGRAIELAGARLLKDAWQIVQKPEFLASDDPTVMWDAALIQLYARAASEQARESGYPLLDNVFYGDYEGALAFMRQYSPDQIFSDQTPLVVGTVAEGWGEPLTSHLIAVTTQALEVQPDLAAAYFLRGWARYLVEPGSADALADIQRAAELAPDDPLFVQSVAYLQ